MKRKIVAACLVAALFTGFTLNAVCEESRIRTETENVMLLFEQILGEDYENEKEEILEESNKKGYDTLLTMETVKSPFHKTDYIELLAAYLTAKNHENTFIRDLDFVTHEIKEEKEYIPEAIKSYKYKESGDGKYIRDGFTYITGKTTVDKYEENGDGTYSKIGVETITPKQKSQKFGDVTISLITPDDIFSFYGIEKTAEIEEEFEYRKHMIEMEVGNKGLSQSVFLSLAMVQSPEEIAQIESLFSREDLEIWQYNLMVCATSLIGKVPYQWGGKSTKEGFDSSWYTFNEEGEQKGLDCSGFVQWAYRTAGFENSVWNNLISTGSILDTQETISEDELEVGDLGLLNHGEKINHVGIYMGDGNWIHCSSSKNGVAVTKNFPFRIYKRVRFDEIYNIDKQMEMQLFIEPNNYTDEDIYLISQCVSHEAKGEGLNGWVAVAEVIKNRIESSDFPSTARDVIYAPGQFSYNEEIADERPTETLISAVRNTMSGSMQILGNPNVVFFQNAGGDESDWEENDAAFYETIGNHQFYTKDKAR